MVSQQKSAAGKPRKIKKITKGGVKVKPANGTVRPIRATAPQPLGDKSRRVSGLQPGAQFASPWTNRNPSKTEIDTSNFGKKIGESMSDRTRDLFKAVHAQNGRRVFRRADLDAGVLRRLGELGMVEYVDGDLGDETCRFRVTARGEQHVTG